MVIFCQLVFYILFFFFFNDTATTEIYTLSLHDALPICVCYRQQFIRRVPAERRAAARQQHRQLRGVRDEARSGRQQDRKSTRLNSSHSQISYAVFCLKKKKTK